jgi:hypothetical protein
MLEMRIVRSPLGEVENQTVLDEYNRLTGAGIPMAEFLRWVQEGPAGPAWHALLYTDEGRVVGHTSVLPVTAQFGENRLLAAMSEYSFVHEDFRKQKIRGYENVSRPPFIIILDHLFQHCLKQGWHPLFASTNEKNQVFTRKVGLRPLEFPLMECLLVLKPVGAARHTPNISTKQRSALFAVGLAQSGWWTVARHIPNRRNGIHAVPIGSAPIRPEANLVSFYEEPNAARWRYIADQYVHYQASEDPNAYVVAKRGRADRYVRVCQYRLSSATPVNSLVRTMIDQARKENAIGVRWAVYDDGGLSRDIVSQLRGLGFLCAPRVRIVMVHKDTPEYLQPSMWRMSDAHFTFDP